MEENTQAVVTETAPQETEDTTAQTASAETEPAPAEGENTEQTATDPAATTPQEEPEDLITYRFNHERKTVSRAEAPKMIQKLLKAQQEAEKSVPLLDKLRFLAEAGGKTPEDFLDSLEAGYDKAEYKRFLDSAGGNEEIAKRLVEIGKKERQQKFKTTAQLREEQSKQKEENATKRMGEELADLQEEFPDIKEFKDVPESVVKEALDTDVSLLDCYLRYLHRNEKKAAAQKDSQAKAAGSSAGSMRGEPEHKEKVDENVAAFLAAFRN